MLQDGVVELEETQLHTLWSVECCLASTHFLHVLTQFVAFGISIAWAIVEYIHEQRGHAKTLFATHYHELNEMEQSFSRIRNYNVSVREVNGKVIFLRKLVRGGSEHSFGIHVAKLAGMPESIVVRADEILHELEGNGNAVA